jgi:hypothetical protein
MVSATAMTEAMKLAVVSNLQWFNYNIWTTDICSSATCTALKKRINSLTRLNFHTSLNNIVVLRFILPGRSMISTRGTFFKESINGKSLSHPENQFV